MEISGWWEVSRSTKEEWRSAGMKPGVPCAMTIGVFKMHELYVDSWDTSGVLTVSHPHRLLGSEMHTDIRTRSLLLN